MKIYDREGNPITLGTAVGRGGEAVVYRVDGRPAWLAKIYEPAPRPNYAAKLAWMLAHPPTNPTHALEHPSLAWPTGLLYGPGKRLAGYLMPYIQQAVPILVVFNPRRRVETLAQFDRRYLHRAARNLATAAGALHTSGYVVGDLNESNVLVISSALVTLIDTDSFQVQEPRNGQVVTYACPVAKPEYTPPELQGKSLASTVRSPEQDAFSLGVLIFQLLMEGNHPFRAQWLGKGDPPPLEERIALGGFPYTSTPGVPVRPPKYAPHLDLLHPEIAELVRRCFIDGHREPRLRPDASAWEKAIAEAEKSLVQCPNRHYYSNHLSACPACHARPAPAASYPHAAPASNKAFDQARGYAQQRTGSAQAAHPPPASPHSAASAAAQRGAPASKAQPASTANPPPPPAPTSSTASSPGSGPASPGGRAANAPGATTSGASAGGASTGRASAGRNSSSPPPAGPAAGRSPAGGATSGFQQAKQVWETVKFWQAQQAQVQQSGPGAGLWGSPQAQQAKAAWNTWKFWQAQQAYVQQAHTQQPTQAAAQTRSQPPSQTPSQRPGSTQPPAQPAPGSPGASPKTNSTAPPAGGGKAQPVQQPGAKAAQAAQKTTGAGATASGPAQNQATAQRPRISTIFRRPPAGAAQPGAAQPAPTSAKATAAQNTPATGAGRAAPRRSQTRWTAPPFTNPQPGRPVYWQPATAPAQPVNSLLVWARPRLLKSLAIGGVLGACAGALPGALVSVAGFSTETMTSWVLLWAIGGAAAGLLRGWQPGYRLSLWVERVIGWRRVWPALGVLGGAALGGFIGFVVGWWAIFPVFLGLLLGGWLGCNAGRKLWQAGAQLGWERIWAVVGALSLALLGWRLAAWLGAGSLSIQLADSFSAWILSQSASLLLASLAVGALGGALGGAVAGTLADLFARLLNLVD